MTAGSREDGWHAGCPSVTAEALDRMPADGDRHELLDGMLVTSPRPGPLHQVVAARLSGMLLSYCPDNMDVLVGPSVRLSRSTVLVADLAVTRRQRPSGGPLTEPPLLAVDIHSPGAALSDPGRRQATWAAFGVRCYWILVPDTRWPKLTAFELAGGHYERLTRAVGGEVFHARQPFLAELVPGRLIAGLRPAERPRDGIDVTA